MDISTDNTPKIEIEEIDAQKAGRLLCLARSLPFGATLDSSPRFSNRGRYSYACADPFLVMSLCRGDAVRLTTRSAQTTCTDGPFESLRRLLKGFQTHDESSPTPFTVGVVGYLSYDLGRSLERLGTGPEDDVFTPDLHLAFYDRTVAIDHSTDRAWAYSVDFSGLNLYEAPQKPFWYEQDAEPVAVKNTIFQAAAIDSSFTRADYIAALDRAKEYIAAGDIYQVNLSQRFKTPMTASPQALYLRLREINPAPYGCFLNFGEHVVASASPEEFLTYDVRTRLVRTSPIKGTRPRGKTHAEDENLKKELFLSEKDRAENIMIVDLERNDLGKVCNYGSISVTDLYGIESHPTVHHLVSIVEGTLNDKRDVVDLLKATFPGGSITGAPKLRSMQIIDELEPVRRGIYTGSAGYIDFRGNMCLNILIRSFLIHRSNAYFHAGGGIVADSNPEAEYQETLDKVAGLMRALETNE